MNTETEIEISLKRWRDFKLVGTSFLEKNPRITKLSYAITKLLSNVQYSKYLDEYDSIVSKFQQDCKDVEVDNALTETDGSLRIRSRKEYQVVSGVPIPVESETYFYTPEKEKEVRKKVRSLEIEVNKVTSKLLEETVVKIVPHYVDPNPYELSASLFKAFEDIVVRLEDFKFLEDEPAGEQSTG